LDVTPGAADEKPTTMEWEVVGEIVGRLAVYGSAIDSHGVIHLGKLDEGAHGKQRLLLKVRDQQRHLSVKSIQAEPEFIRAHLEPYDRGDNHLGLYHFHVEIPNSAPECTYLGLKLGRLRVEFDHPRIHELELKVRFAVGG
jgi:hypothetical protein